MGETILTTPQTWIEYIPAHRFVGLYDIHAKGYVDFEKYEDFDRIEGILESMVPVQHPVVWAHHAGWFYNAGKVTFMVQELLRITQELFRKGLKYVMFRQAIIWYLGTQNMTI